MIVNGWLRKLGLGLVLLILAGQLSIPMASVQAAEQQRYFPETHHMVRGAFLEFFDQYGGLEIFGYPLTEPFVNNGIRVQVFQNARFEEHPDNPIPYRVQLGLLGVELKYASPPVPSKSLATRTHHYFPETGHNVSHGFLQFFRDHGGIDVFGYPITEMVFEDGRIVQYFQRMKMEWDAENRASPVQLGKLGELYLDLHRENLPPEAFAPARNPQLSDFVPAKDGMYAAISLGSSVLSREKDQVVSLRVTTLDGQPRPNAQVRIQLLSATGEVLGRSAVVLTDARGFIRVPVALSGGQRGDQVLARATVAFGTLETIAEDVFLLWW